MNEFFMALPAMLAVGVFIIFHVLKQREHGDPVSIKIIDKLRKDIPERLENREGLNSKQLFELLQRDNLLREKVSDQDYRLLERSLTFDLIKAIVVYLVSTLLFVFSVGAYIYHTGKPEELNVKNIKLVSLHPKAGGLAVDLDTLKLDWVSSGEPEELKVFLENIDTGLRSNDFKVSSLTGSIEFTSRHYAAILQNRTFGEWNRVRAVFQATNDSFYSQEFKLHVGLTIIAINFGEKVKIGAMIDNSVLQGYNFDVKLVVWNKKHTNTLSLGGGISNGQRDFSVEKSYQYNWSEANMVYLSPDDPRLIRIEIVFDAEQLAEAKENSISSDASDYLGIWYSEYTENFENGQSCQQKGTTQLYPERKYAYSGVISCVGNINSQPFEAIYNFRAGGIWSIFDELLVFEIKDVNSKQVRLSLGGIEVPYNQTYKASDEVTRNMPFSFEILDMSAERIVTRKHAPDGGYTEVSLIRRDKPFFP